MIRSLHISILVVLFILTGTLCANAQGNLDRDMNKKYKVVGGVMQEVEIVKGDSSIVEKVIDKIDSDTLKKLSDRQKRQIERAIQDADSTFKRHNKYFRDSIPISRLCLINAGLPGFAQLYNGQPKKIPFAYAALGSTITLSILQNNKYQIYKKEYDAIIRDKGNDRTDELDRVQGQMIKHNTYRQLFFAGAVASYIYFIADGAINYPGTTSSVKKATTLSTICPGAGQVYNKSYWKVPIVIGGFATMAFVIDWNNKGYQRFKTAYDLAAAGKPHEFTDKNKNYETEDQLLNAKNQWRRSRDLAIIMTGGMYLINIVDAHVDAHLKDYDISDDLAINITPVANNFRTLRTGSFNTFGVGLNITF